jgi:hydrogenase-4 component F
MRMSFTHFDGEIQVKEKFLRLAPSYILLLTSLVLCVWMPEELYQTLMNIVTSIGGGFHE